ncbi:hypothetical protein D3C85_1896440 [compost metagenome]
MNSSAHTVLAAATISSSVASSLPYRMLSMIVPEKIKLSCSIMPIWLRSDWSVTREMSSPSIMMRPPFTS